MVEGTRRGNSSLSLSLKFKCGWDSDETEPPTPRAAPGTTGHPSASKQFIQQSSDRSGNFYLFSPNLFPSFNLAAMSNMGGEVLSTTTVSSSHEYERDCIRIQDQLKTKLVVGDDFAWILPSGFSSSPAAAEGEAEEDKSLLRYIGGVDVSFSKADRNSSSSLACAALVVLDARSLKLIYEDYTLVRIHTPYVPGFLAFREAPVLLQLLDKMKRDDHPHYPQVLMVDGNGLLHPRGFGLACHLGVLADLPTIGIGKSLHHVDDLSQSGVRQHLEEGEICGKDLVPLIGKSGQVWGMALRSTSSSSKPIYISIGHRISLDSSVKVVRSCCKFRLPEPIRLADIRSRVFLQKMQD